MKRLMVVGVLASLSFVAPALADGKHHGPPPAAFDACKGKADGDACSYEGRKGVVNGTCRPAHKVEALVCMHPHRHQ
jgi:hypothetical protein